MIVFNIPAAIIVFAIIALNYFLSLYFSDFLDIDHPFFWLTFFSISSITEITKIKGRVFRIPLWIIGITGFIITFVNDYQRSGSFVPILILIVIWFIAFFIIKSFNTKKWNKAKQALEELSHLEPDFSNPKFRANFKKAFFVPQYLIPDNSLQYMVFGKIYNSLYAKWFAKNGRNIHYLKLMDMLKRTTPTDIYKAKVSVFHSRLLKLKEGESATIEEYMLDNVHKVMNSN